MRCNDYEEVKSFVSEKRGERDALQRQLESAKKQLDKTQKDAADMIEARNYITQAMTVTQRFYKEQIEELVTLAIEPVFPDKEYRFVVDFTSKKSGHTEVNLLVVQGDNAPYVPREEQGGALTDIISFALRVVLWSLENPKSRNVMIFDEPFRFAGELITVAGDMMKKICKELGIQNLVVTHSPELMELADKSWHVIRKGNGATTIEETV